MAKIKKIYEDSARTQDIYPITHEKAVIDNNGTTAETKFQMITDLVNQKQMEIGAVPSDLKPTPNSTNWVTSGGVCDELYNVTSLDVSYGGDYTWILGTITSAGKAQSSASYYHINIPVSGGMLVNIKANAERVTKYAFLKDINFSYTNNPGADISSHYCDGYNEGIDIEAGKSASFTIPEDCNYLYVLCGQTSGYVHAPESVVWYSPKLDIAQELGNSTEKVVSQKAVTDALEVLGDNLIDMSVMSADSSNTTYLTATKDAANNGVVFNVVTHITSSLFGRIYQMHLIAGKTYRLSFDYLNTAYSTVPSFRDSGNVYIPSSISEVSVNVNTSYETYTCTFVAPEGVYYLAFASLTFGTANSSLTIKNFNCVEITSLKKVVEELDKVYDELQRFGHESLEMKQGTIVSGEITMLSTRIYSNIVNAPCYIRVKNGYSVTGVNWFSAKDYGSTNYIKNDWRTYRREINIFDSGYVAFVITNAGASGNISPSADCIEVFQNGDQYNAVNARMLEALKDYNFSIPQLGCGRKMISRPSDTYVHAPSVNITKKYLFITYHSSMHKTSESFNDNRITLYVRDNEWGWTDYIDIFDDLMVDLKIGNDRITYIYNQNVINTDDNTLFVMAGAHVGSDWAWVYRFFDAPNNVLSAPAIVQLSYGGNTVDFNLSNYIAMLNTLYGKSYTAVSSINSNELSGIAKSGSTYYSVFALLVTSSNGIVPHVLMSSPDCITWTPIAMLSDTHKNCETTLTILNNKIYIGFRMVSDGVFYMVTDLEGTIIKDWTKVSNVSSRSCMTQAGGKVYYAYNVANGSSKHWSRNAMCIAEVNQSTYELTTIKTYYSNDGYNYFALCPTLNQNLMVVNTEDSRGYNYASGNATTDINIAEIELLTS